MHFFFHKCQASSSAGNSASGQVAFWFSIGSVEFTSVTLMTEEKKRRRKLEKVQTLIKIRED